MKLEEGYYRDLTTTIFAGRRLKIQAKHSDDGGIWVRLITGGPNAEPIATTYIEEGDVP